MWVGCHTLDYDEPWYENTDEETFRPWTGKLPADASAGMLLVKATLELHDGSRHPGFVTPALKEGDLGTQQPQIFAGNRRLGDCRWMMVDVSALRTAKEADNYSTLALNYAGVCKPS